MKKSKKILILLTLSIIIVSVIGIYLFSKLGEKPGNKFEPTDEEKDLADIDKYYLERSDSKIRASRMYGDYEFYDVSFFGDNNYYVMSGCVKNKSDRDVDYITFVVQYLDEHDKIVFEEDGIAGFDENKFSVMHLETTEIIPLYYNYKITNIKEFKR